MAQGGYQAPSNPAPVSLPGRLSRRTDGGPSNPGPTQAPVNIPDAEYGEQATFRQDQAAPMAATPGPDQAQAQPVDLSNVTPFNAPTAHPDQPVTSGADAGAGPGAASLGFNAANDPSVQQLKNSLPALELMANQPTAGFAFRQFVRYVKAAM